MTGSLDPWRTLGLTPGASIDEIRRAYRRLAKANHPDAAGESALPRFLAIQSAYETLAAPKRSRRPGSRPGPAATGEPWRADPERARASGGATSARRPTPGSRPRGSPSAGPARGAASNEDPAGPDRPMGGRPKPGRAEEPGASRRTGGRRRPSNRATPGSTSYDAADEEPFEPGWTGATWYGASSGTYWTINPKEYADPRKHGPEYQRRARRSASGSWVLDDEPALEPDRDAPDRPSAADPSPVDQPQRPSRSERPRRRATARDDAGATSGPVPQDEEATRPDAARRSSWTSADHQPEARGTDGGERPASGGRGTGTARTPGPAGVGLAAPLLHSPTTPAGRLGLALLGWPPLGVAVSTAIGETTGCGRFSASCAEVFSPGTWIVQIAIILLLLALPRLAGWSAVGTLVSLAAAVPTAVLLSAGGASRQPEASVAVLMAVLGLAYVGGVAWAIAGRWRPWAQGGRVP
jgi:curved DNA-binding protein CbpA